MLESHLGQNSVCFRLCNQQPKGKKQTGKNFFQHIGGFSIEHQLLESFAPSTNHQFTTVLLHPSLPPAPAWGGPRILPIKAELCSQPESPQKRLKGQRIYILEVRLGQYSRFFYLVGFTV